MKNFVSALIAVFCLSVCLPAAGSEKVVDRTFAAGKGGTMYLESDLGSVEINSHSGNEVIVKVELQTRAASNNKAEELFDNFELSFEQKGKDVIIKGELQERWIWNNFRLQVRYHITVPNEYNLRIDTAGGGIKVADILGQVDLHTSGGSIGMGKITGPVNARTSGGSITLESSAGNGRVHTSGGSIRIGSVKGDLEAVTSGGGIEVDDVGGNLSASSSGGGLQFRNIAGNLSGKTSGGPIKATLTSQITEPVELRTSGGSIVLELPDDFNADLDAATSGGRVYTDLPIRIQGYISRNALTGALNKGGPKVVLRTSGGNIEIRKQN
jgi:hypothetical protein